MVRVLFVCLGNICRSPTAEGVFRALVTQQGLADKIEIDSAGTGAWHVGKPPDRRAQQAARARGIDLSALRGRQATGADFQRFDYVLAMDQDNFANLARLCPPGHQDRLKRFLDFAPDQPERDVPDPYYGGDGGFEHVLDLIEEASRGLLAELRKTHGF